MKVGVPTVAVAAMVAGNLGSVGVPTVAVPKTRTGETSAPAASVGAPTVVVAGTTVAAMRDPAAMVGAPTVAVPATVTASSTTRSVGCSDRGRRLNGDGFLAENERGCPDSGNRRD